MRLRDALNIFRKPETRAIDALPWDVGGPLRPASVSADQALGLVPVFAAVRILASQVASLPLQTFRRSFESREQLATPSLFRNPSVNGTLYDWLHRCMTSLALRGNAFGYITARDRDQYPTMIEWLHPDDIRVDDRAMSGPGSFTQPVWYWQGRIIPAEDLLHIPWFTIPGRILGLSPIGACAVTISTGISAQHYTSDWFDSGAVPPGEFKNTAKTVNQTEADIISARLNAAIKRRKPLVYGSDWEYKPIAVSAHEAKFVETMRLNATQVAAIYGIPPEMIGGEAGGPLTYNTVESNAQALEKFTLRPWLEMLEYAFSSLLPRPQYVKFNLDALLRTDFNSRVQAFKTAREMGLHNIDELRALEDHRPLPNGQGQDYTPLQALIGRANQPQTVTRYLPRHASDYVDAEVIEPRELTEDVEDQPDWDPDEPDPDDFLDPQEDDEEDDDESEDDDEDVGRAMPDGLKGGARLKWYWTKGPGLAKWATKAHRWTALYRQLLKYMPPGKAKRTAASWFHSVFGYWPGHQKGKNPVGPRALGADAFTDLHLRRADPFDPLGLASDLRHRPGLHDQSKHGRPGVKGALKKAVKEIAEAVDVDKPESSKPRRPSGDAAARFKKAARGRDALDAAPADFRFGSKRSIPLSSSERRALDEYANDAQKINDQIRRGRLTAKSKTTVRQIDKVMARSKLTSDVEVWRGVNTGRPIFGKDLDGDVTGFQWTEDAYVSTSATRLVAEQFAGSFDTKEPVVVMRILAPEGTGAVAMSDVGGGGALGGQAEVLLERDRSYQVIADRGVIDHPQVPQGIRLIDVIVEPANP